jgi:hypothetical protein
MNERFAEKAQALAECFNHLSAELQRCAAAFEAFDELTHNLAIDLLLEEATTIHVLAGVYECPIIWLDEVLRLREGS